MKDRVERHIFRQLRTRAKIRLSTGRPPPSVFRSLKNIYAQIIDDAEGKTLVAASSIEKGISKASGVKQAAAVGETVAKRAVEKGVKEVVFDRGGRPYHGQVKALADAAREA